MLVISGASACQAAVATRASSPRPWSTGTPHHAVRGAKSPLDVVLLRSSALSRLGVSCAQSRIRPVVAESRTRIRWQGGGEGGERQPLSFHIYAAIRQITRATRDSGFLEHNSAFLGDLGPRSARLALRERAPGGADHIRAVASDPTDPLPCVSQAPETNPQVASTCCCMHW